MKKAIKSVVFCVPIFFFIVCFFRYEPYNYFGIRSERGDSSNAITIMRELINKKGHNIILGHSKMAPLDTKDLIKAGITEEVWTNMCFSGAHLNEQCDLFWFANSNSELNKVSVVVSFYGSGNGGYIDRVNQVAEMVNWRNYIFNPQSYKTAFELCKKDLLMTKAITDYKGKTYSAETKKVIFDDYVKRIWIPFAQNYIFDYKGLSELIDVIMYCKEKGIEIAIYALPMRSEIYKVLEEENVLQWIFLYKKILSQYTTVYDMEYPENIWSQDYDYIEGCHFEGIDRVGENNFCEEYPMLYDSLCMMFQGTAKDYIVWENVYPEIKQLLKEDTISLLGNNELEVWYQKVEVESDKVYEISYTGGDFSEDTEMEIFYMDLYGGAEYDSQRQNMSPATLQYNGTKWAVVFSDEIPEDTDIYLRIIYKGTENITINNLIFSELVCE